MKKKNINQVFDFLKIIIGIVFLLLLLSMLSRCAQWIDEDKRQLDEMKSYHSDKGFVEENDGYLNIRTYEK